MRNPALARELAKRYEGGTPIRALAEEQGRSYGFIHRLLIDAGATLRLRGGDQRRTGQDR
ncbi:helix-turn-helix domain-containing protein [Streptomyces mirabilis]